MIKPLLEVRLRKKNTNGYDSSYYDVTSLINTDTDAGLESKKDTFSFSVMNASYIDDDTGTSVSNTSAYRTSSQGTQPFPFDIDDNILIYSSTSGSFATDINDNLIMDGIITRFDRKITQDKDYFTVAGANRTEVMLNTLAPATFDLKTSDGIKPPHTMIIDIISKMNSYQTRYQIKASPATGAVVNGEWVRTGGGYIWPNKADGNAFPGTEKFVSNFKNGFQLLEELSQIKYTGDTTRGTYLFWVDKDSNLHWEPPSSTYEREIDILNTSRNDFTVGKDAYNIINALIIHAGNDPKNAGTTTFCFNWDSIAKNGMKWKFEPMTDVAKNVMKIEEAIGPLNNVGSFIQVDKKFPSGYPWTMSYYQVETTRPYRIGAQIKDSSGVSIGSDVNWTVSNDAEYQDAIRAYSKRIAYLRGLDILDITGKARLKASYKTMYPTGLTAGNIYKLTNIPDFNDIILRLKSIKNNYTKQGGWEQTYDFEEDTKTSYYTTT